MADDYRRLDRLAWGWAAALGGVVAAVAAVVLRLMGRVWWCQCQSLVPYSFEVASRHNSQHLLDAYTFTHVLHGLIYYGLLWLTVRRRLGRPARLVVALGLESAWEVLENTEAVIRRYREATLSLDYFGDSVLNSLADIVACAVGYLLAMTLPVAGSVTLFIVTEAVLLLTIHDSLLLNVLLLVHPLESLKRWQLEGLLVGVSRAPRR